MDDLIADKRRARNAIEFTLVVKEFCKKEPMKESIRLLKAMLSRVTGGKEDRRIDKDTQEATALALGRDTAWKQSQVEIMRGLQKAITKSRLEGKVFDMPWCTFVNKCIQSDVLDVANFLLQVRLGNQIIEQDYLHGGGTVNFDPWDSVHFYSLDIVANIVISSFWENPGSKRFLRKMITTGTFEKILMVVEDMTSERFLTTCLAVYIAANVCSQVRKLSTSGAAVNKGIVKSANIVSKIAHFIHKDNAIKMATEWFQNGVEQFEFDALTERPDGLAVMNTDGVFMLGCQEMSRRKTLQSAINWAISLQYHSIMYLAAICHLDVGYQDVVMKERGICKSLRRWMATPIYNADVCLMVQSSLRVLGQIGDNMSATWTFLADKNVMKYLEVGMHYPNARAVSLYLEVVTKLSRHRGLPRDQIMSNEAFCRAAVLHLYSLEETVNVFALAFLHILAESNIDLFLELFPPHEITLFKEFFFDKTDSGLNVSDLIVCCIRFNKKQYDAKVSESPPRVNYDIDKSSVLKDEGNNFFKQSEYKKAIEKYTEAIVTCPPTVKADGKKLGWNILMVTLFCNRAQCYLKDDQYQEAVEDCDIAVARCLGAAERLKDFDNELFKKAVYRRSLALFNLKEYERAAIDIGECVILEQERKEFRAHMDKVVMMCRHIHGWEHIRKCIECDGAKGLPLKKCPNCPALYCSRVCQLEAWRNHHRTNCTWFMNTNNHGSIQQIDEK